MINKDTKLYGSFSMKAGNNGNIFFNNEFKNHNIDAIYKSFSVKNIKDAVNAAKTLKFSGFAVSMPFKKVIINYVDEVTEDVNMTQSSNTILIKNGKLKAYNTDIIGVKKIIEKYDNLIILGDGAMSRSSQYACKILNKKYDLITRKNWNDIKKIRNKTILNCTPVENIIIDNSNTYLDAIPTTETGKKIHNILAKEQFFLYTGIKIN